jgi:hypothetical protein
MYSVYEKYGSLTAFTDEFDATGTVPQFENPQQSGKGYTKSVNC